MKKICGFLLVFVLFSTAFATTISTEKEVVYAPSGSYNLIHIWGERLRFRHDKLMVETTLEWQAWHDPRRPDRSYKKDVSLDLVGVTHNKATKELLYNGKRIGYTKEDCGWFSCATIAKLDHQYDVQVWADGVGSVIDVTGQLHLFDDIN